MPPTFLKTDKERHMLVTIYEKTVGISLWVPLFCYKNEGSNFPPCPGFINWKTRKNVTYLDKHIPYFLSSFTASFLIPYFLTLVTCGIPLFYLELALGQYLSLGPVKAWAVVCPVLKGTPCKGATIFHWDVCCNVSLGPFVPWII